MTAEPTSELHFREARRGDLETLVALLADDPLGSTRERFESPLPESYVAAFEAVDRDANHQLLIAEAAGVLAGFLQLSFLPYLTYQGGWRALVEGVRVAPSARGRGVGRALVDEAIRRARTRGCHLVQLTTDKTRPDALRFYERAGFVASHEGMKLHLRSPLG